MSLSFIENFDGVTAPALPAGWNVDAALITSTAKYYNSPNCLYLNDSSNVKKYATYGTSAGDNMVTGGASLIGRIDATGAEGNQYRFGVAYRGSAATLNNSSTTYYWVYVETIPVSGDKLVFASVNNGTVTAITTVNIIGTVYSAGWFQLNASVTVNTHSIQLIRLSDNYFLNSSGSFVNSAETAIQTNDSTYTSGNYVGIVAQGQSQLNRVYMDAFYATSGGGVAMPRTLVVPYPAIYYQEDYRYR